MTSRFPKIHLLILTMVTGMSACGVPAPASSGVGSTDPLSPTPVPPATTNYSALSEEALASHIASTVAQAESKGQTLMAIVTQASVDGLITDEETAQGLSSIAATQAEIASAQEQIHAYDELYAEIAPESIDLLMTIDRGLRVMATSTDVVATIMEQKADIAPETLESLDIALAQIKETELQAQAASWLRQVQTGLSVREKYYANIQPQLGLVAHNRVDAFIQAHDFADAYRVALSDGRFSPGELANVSQLGATAEASLYNTGDWQIMDLAQQIDALIDYALRGEWSLARDKLDELTQLMPGRPHPYNTAYP